MLKSEITQALRDEAADCKASCEKNGSPYGEIFNVVSIMLASLASRLEPNGADTPNPLRELSGTAGVGVDAVDAKGDAAERATTGAVRSNLYPPGGKFPARYDLIFRNASGLRRLAETFGEGVAKYGPDNWMNGFPESVMVSHALEHFRLFMGGDTSEDHLSHAAWNILTLMWIQDNKPELLDLTKPSQQL